MPGSAARADALTDGIIVVDKPAGPTSHGVVALVRRLAGVRRVGHGGTLDPFAAGVLPVFLGRATRVVEYHLADDKAYRARIAFGARSTTDDLDGELTPTSGEAPERATVEEALVAFRGPLVQIPPDYSAVHVAGRRAYELARAGQKPELTPRRVTIHRLELSDWEADEGGRPIATLEVSCSAGTYVRALARDIGQRLGCGAYLVGLTRTASGPFRLADAQPLDAVRAALAEGRLREVLLPMDTGLGAWPVVTLAPEELAAVARGQVIRPSALPSPGIGDDAGGGALVRILTLDGRLAAIGRVRAGRLHPDKVLIDLPAAATAAASAPAAPAAPRG